MCSFVKKNVNSMGKISLYQIKTVLHELPVSLFISPPPHVTANAVS